MKQGLAAADRDDRYAESGEFVDAREHFGERNRLRGVVKFVAVSAGEIAAPDRDDLSEHRASAMLHGGSEHADLAATAADGGDLFAQGITDRHSCLDLPRSFVS